MTAEHIETHNLPPSNTEAAQAPGPTDGCAVSETELRSTRGAADQIERCFKEAFPETEYVVRTRQTSSGRWITLSWKDGPLVDRVREVCGRWAPGIGQNPRTHDTVMTPPCQTGRRAATSATSMVESISYIRHYSPGLLLSAQRLLQSVLPDVAVYDEDGEYVPVLATNHWLPAMTISGEWFPESSAHCMLVAIADRFVLSEM